MAGLRKILMKVSVQIWTSFNHMYVVDKLMTTMQKYMIKVTSVINDSKFHCLLISRYTITIAQLLFHQP